MSYHVKNMKPDSELLLNPDQSIFHLHLKPQQIANTILLVGDPERVDIVASFFQDIEYKISNREYITVTGSYSGKRITVTSTGVGVGNIDIVMNEFDALANIDFTTGFVNERFKKLNFIRIGTSGSLQKQIPVNSWVVSKRSIGFDNMIRFYDAIDSITDKGFQKKIMTSLHFLSGITFPYVVKASDELLEKLVSEQVIVGNTVTAPGFYAPQGRKIRLKPKIKKMNKQLEDFIFEDESITNYEMENAAIYALGKLFGHNVVSICLIIANRVTSHFNEHYRENMKKLINYVLAKVQ